MKKSKIRQNVLQTVLHLEVIKGHLKWKVSDLARLAKVSRPLVYYHFGNTKQEILNACIDLIALEYFGLDESRIDTLKEGRALESLLQTRKMFLENPSLAVFYQRWRMQVSPVQLQLIAIEKRYQAKIAAAYPFLKPAQVVALHGLFHGLITAPFMTEAAFKEAYAAIFNWVSHLAKGR